MLWFVAYIVILSSFFNSVFEHERSSIFVCSHLNIFCFSKGPNCKQDGEYQTRGILNPGTLSPLSMTGFCYQVLCPVHPFCLVVGSLLDLSPGWISWLALDLCMRAFTPFMSYPRLGPIGLLASPWAPRLGVNFKGDGLADSA